MTFVHASLVFALLLAPAPQGQTINARHGDLVVIPPTAEVRLIRRGDAQVRAIFNTAQHSVILLVDYVAWDGHQPDNRVDVAYRFVDVEGNWPFGVPLLDPAAIDAARQWRYEPTLLNGAPVPVIMTATVSLR